MLETGRRWDGDELAIVRADDLPVALVHIPVMPVTEKSKVGEFV
jgi:hypothetical protein